PVETAHELPELPELTVRQFYVGSHFVIAQTSEHRVFVWGHLGEHGKPVNKRNYCKPHKILFDNICDNIVITQISCGVSHVLVLDDRGRVFGWGCNWCGQLAVDPNVFMPNAVEIQFPEQYVIEKVVASYWVSFAITSDGQVLMWGENVQATNNNYKQALIPNLYAVKNIYWIEKNRFCFIQMPFYENTLLDIMIAKPHAFGRKFGQTMDYMEFYITCELFAQLVDGMSYLHGLSPPIIHRNLKTTNIFVTSDGLDNSFIKIADYGFEKFDKLGVKPVAKSGYEGLSKYTALEVIKGRKYGLNADVYSLGIIGDEFFEVYSKM
ncbi:unnamed protein product, partial [Oppiella nova]